MRRGTGFAPRERLREHDVQRDGQRLAHVDVPDRRRVGNDRIGDKPRRELILGVGLRHGGPARVDDLLDHPRLLRQQVRPDRLTHDRAYATPVGRAHGSSVARDEMVQLAMQKLSRTAPSIAAVSAVANTAAASEPSDPPPITDEQRAAMRAAVERMLQKKAQLLGQ